MWPALLLGAYLGGKLIELLLPPPTEKRTTQDLIEELTAITDKLPGVDLFDPELDDKDLEQFDPDPEHKLYKKPVDFEESPDWEIITSKFDDRAPVPIYEARTYNFSLDRWEIDAPELQPMDPMDLIKFGMFLAEAGETQYWQGTNFEFGGKELLLRDWFRMLGFSLADAEEMVEKGITPWHWWNEDSHG